MYSRFAISDSFTFAKNNVYKHMSNKIVVCDNTVQKFLIINSFLAYHATIAVPNYLNNMSNKQLRQTAKPMNTQHTILLAGMTEPTSYSFKKSVCIPT